MENILCFYVGARGSVPMPNDMTQHVRGKEPASGEFHPGARACSQVHSGVTSVTKVQTHMTHFINFT